MKRKVVQQGPSTLMVSLPQKWVKEHNILKGQELELNEDNNDLIISFSGHKKRLKDIDIYFELNDWRYIRSTLGGLYKKGYDVIRIKYDKPEIFKMIEKSVNTLIGYEIFDKSLNNCEIRSMRIDQDSEKELIISKMFNLIKTVQIIVREDYLNGVYPRFEELEDFRNTGWKFRDYSMRLIIGSNNNSNLSSYGFVIIVWTIEKINRNYYRIYRDLINDKLKLDKEVLKFYDEMNNYVLFLANSIQKFDFSKIEKLNNEYVILKKRGLELLKKHPEQSSFLSHIIENIGRVQDCASSIVIQNY